MAMLPHFMLDIFIMHKNVYFLSNNSINKKTEKTIHNLDLTKVTKMTNALDLLKVCKISSLRQSALKSI